MTWPRSFQCTEVSVFIAKAAVTKHCQAGGLTNRNPLSRGHKFKVKVRAEMVPCKGSAAGRICCRPLPSF